VADEGAGELEPGEVDVDMSFVAGAEAFEGMCGSMISSALRGCTMSSKVKRENRCGLGGPERRGLVDVEPDVQPHTDEQDRGSWTYGEGGRYC
jgi:hypothetical protein